MKSLLSRRPLTSFFVLAYLGSWLMWSPWWLSRNGIGLLPYDLPFSAVAGINQLGLFAGPFAAALLMTRLTEGREGVGRFWRRIIQWRVHARWYAAALVVIPLAAGLGYLLTGSVVPAVDRRMPPVAITLAITYVVYLLGGPFQEEPGWRGFALPRLQERLHPATSALLLGVIHCCWHAPLFLTDDWDTARDEPGQLLAYLLLVVSLSFVMSWLANGSNHSVLLAILAHNGVNWGIHSGGVLGGSGTASNWPAAIGMAVLAIIAVVVTRGRLAYRPAAAQSA
ncbi:hypothetical protein CGZ91_04985 [Parenemella sanctibonifatiensis]|uniref:CAAX prenyl protease 2/Lysostaphin resistance protein A-like domain-containing protein n=1 Tax=Parenemella sanctibonifatiensis TaxID=2016505 RepID=A0A255EH35_9ACTN|nr:hypothetical protein CGZ91_04985 [Parenemella sanctibonifatiensis]